MFRRRRSTEPAPVDLLDTEDSAEAAGTAADGTDNAENDDAGDAVVAEREEAASGPVGRDEGPWDASEVEDPAEGGRINLGGLWMPGVPGMEMRIELNEESGAVISVTAVLGQSALQVQPFAAPRSGGLWPDVVGELAAGVAQQGGQTLEQQGPWGTELFAEIPGHLPDGTPGVQAARFIGIEGPRWLLRAVITGQAYVDPDAAAALERVLRQVVVVRGDAPRARGELLELRLPPQAVTGAADNAGEAGDAEDDGTGGDREPLNPFRRGPEITEVR